MNDLKLRLPSRGRSRAYLFDNGVNQEHDAKNRFSIPGPSSEKLMIIPKKCHFFVKLLKSFDLLDLKISTTRLKMNELVIRQLVLRLSVLIIRTEIRTWPRSKEWMSGKIIELIKNVKSGSNPLH